MCNKEEDWEEGEDKKENRKGKERGAKEKGSVSVKKCIRDEDDSSGSGRGGAGQKGKSRKWW